MSILYKGLILLGVPTMKRVKNERREPRLRYQWTVLFAVGSSQTVSEGLMVDVASGGLAFKCTPAIIALASAKR